MRALRWLVRLHGQAWAEARIHEKVGLALMGLAASTVGVGAACAWLSGWQPHPAAVVLCMAAFGFGGMLTLGFEE